MTQGIDDTQDCFVLEAGMALPNQYFAGEIGSKFIIFLREWHKILGVHCPSCNKTFVPPRENCELCWTKLNGNWVEVGSEGEVTSFTVVRYYDKHLPKRPPYILALIKLDGADTALAHVVEGINPRDVHPGLRVKAVFAKEATDTLMAIDHFEPA